MAPVAIALQAMRGVTLVVAVTVVAAALAPPDFDEAALDVRSAAGAGSRKTASMAGRGLT